MKQTKPDEKKPSKKDSKRLSASDKAPESSTTAPKKTRKNEGEPSITLKFETINLNNQNYTKIKKFIPISQAGKGEDGVRKTNQDSYIVMEKIANCECFNLFGVMDGHGPKGELVSQFITRYINQKLTSTKKFDNVKDEDEIYNILKKNNYEVVRHLFTHGEKELIKGGSIDANFSGTTCVIIIQIGNHLISANVGDSRAIMVNKNGVIPLSVDQKPDNPEERQRIEKAGGEISQYEEDGEKSGPFRVWQKGQPYPGIAMSRSIGDLIASSLGVISEPVIEEFRLDSDVKYIVLASDGVWEFLDNNKVATMVQPYYEKKDPDNACKALIKESTQWWENEDVVIDDITCIVIFF